MRGPLSITCRKSKDYDPVEPIQLALHSIDLPWKDEDGEAETSAVLRLAGKTSVVQGGNQFLAANILKKLLHAAKGEPVTVKEWRKETKLDRKRWAEAHTALVEKGVVLIDGEFACLP